MARRSIWISLRAFCDRVVAHPALGFSLALISQSSRALRILSIGTHLLRDLAFRLSELPFMLTLSYCYSSEVRSTHWIATVDHTHFFANFNASIDRIDDLLNGNSSLELNRTHSCSGDLFCRRLCCGGFRNNSSLDENAPSTRLPLAFVCSFSKVHLNLS